MIEAFLLKLSVMYCEIWRGKKELLNNFWNLLKGTSELKILMWNNQNFNQIEILRKVFNIEFINVLKTRQLPPTISLHLFIVNFVNKIFNKLDWTSRMTQLDLKDNLGYADKKIVWGWLGFLITSKKPVNVYIYMVCFKGRQHF